MIRHLSHANYQSYTKWKMLLLDVSTVNFNFRGKREVKSKNLGSIKINFTLINLHHNAHDCILGARLQKTDQVQITREYCACSVLLICRYLGRCTLYVLAGSNSIVAISCILHFFEKCILNSYKARNPVLKYGNFYLCQGGYASGPVCFCVGLFVRRI